MADAPKINPKETLRESYPKLNQAIDNANEAIKKATTSDVNAAKALTTANSVQEQFNQVVIEGDSSVEAAQARVSSTGTTYTTLKERLDQEHESVTTQLANNEKDLLSRRVNVDNFPRLAPEISDSPRISRALDFLDSVGGGTLFLPKTLNEYIINTPVLLRNDIAVEGNFTTVTSNTITNMFDVSNLKNVSISGFVFELGDVDDVTSRGIYGANPENIIIDKCLFLNGSTGVYLSDVVNGTISNCIFNKNRHWSVHVAGCDGLKYLYNISSNQRTYDGLKISGGSPTGLYKVCKNILVKGNICFLNKRDGFDIACNGGYNIKIIDNLFFSNEENGIDFKFIYQVAKENGQDLDLSDSVIEGNTLIGNGYKGVNIQADVGLIRDIIIKGNIIRYVGNNASASSYGINTRNCKNIRITQNNIYGFYCGVRLTDTDNSIVDDNFFEDNRRDIMLDVQRREKMLKNHIRGNDLRTNEIYDNQRIYILNAGVFDTRIYKNTYDYASAQKPISDNGSNTIAHDNIRGYSDVSPNINGSKGDVVINSDIKTGSYQKWICISDGSGYWKGVNLIN